jgi:hypothetical protein
MQTSIVSRMSRRTCLGKLASALAYLTFWDLDCELGLDEAELNVWFLLLVETKFHLGCCCRSHGLNQMVVSHVRGF